MWSVYVLYNPNRTDKKFYVGLTNNVSARLKKHKTGKVYFTHKNHNDWFLVYAETYLAKSDAARREQRLKDHGRAFRQLKERTEGSIALTK